MRRARAIAVAAMVAGAGTGVAAGDAEYGAYLAGQCVTCHGGGAGADGIPSLRGLPSEDFVQALKAYRRGERSNPVMVSIARSLSDEEVAALAAYYEQAR